MVWHLILNLTYAPPFCFKYHLYLFTCLICCHYYMCITTCREMTSPKVVIFFFCSIPLAVLFAIKIILNATNVPDFCFKYYIIFVHVLDLLSLLYVYYLSGDDKSKGCNICCSIPLAVLFAIK